MKTSAENSEDKWLNRLTRMQIDPDIGIVALGQIRLCLGSLGATPVDPQAFVGLAFADFAKVEIHESLSNLNAWRANVAARPNIAGQRTFPLRSKGQKTWN